jgi:hypothetical protein
MPTTAPVAISIAVGVCVLLFVACYAIYSSKDYIEYNKVPDISRDVATRSMRLRFAEQENADFTIGREAAANLQRFDQALLAEGTPNGPGALSAFLY